MSKSSSKNALILDGLRALQALLVQVYQMPAQFSPDTELRAALKTQGGLASLARSVDMGQGEFKSTFPVSLNTLKTHANENLVGGFRSLDNLRTKAIEALDRADKQEQRANKRSKSGLTLKVHQLEQELEMQRQTNVILLQALSECMHQFTSIRDASSDSMRAKRTNDALQILRAITSMAIPPFNILPIPVESSNSSKAVPNIDDYRKR
ncbi:hypothetical protein [Pseudomonas aeruginosa]|uniref:hypothetical protein n=1 Tax=Pseudomonas aeruginosa TaxID=287 RepID=UPI000FC423CA|nr:hypothetical protein [Pseudomonas aeruginosa]RUF04484.1 hypothetical protein IPC1134_16045 [Pseudomonas aeruginosa]